MKKIAYLFLADGFELIEAMTPVDVLRRAGVEVTTVSIDENSLVVESSQKVKVTADKSISSVDFKKGDMVIIPGGFPGYINLSENKKVVEIVSDYLKDKDRYVGAICGGPTLLGVNNLISDYKFTSHSSVVDEMNSTNYLKENVVRDKNLITAVGAGKSLDFAFALAEILVDKETIENVKKGMELL